MFIVHSTQYTLHTHNSIETKKQLHWNYSSLAQKSKDKMQQKWFLTNKTFHFELKIKNLTLNNWNIWLPEYHSVFTIFCIQVFSFNIKMLSYFNHFYKWKINMHVVGTVFYNSLNAFMKSSELWKTVWIQVNSI